MDNPRNQDQIGEKELLVVSFGTSFNESRHLTIGAVEDALEKAFPEYSVRRAFTSGMIIKHIKDRDGVQIDNVKEALDRAVKNGVKKLLVQPTHLMNGLEYQKLMRELEPYRPSFEKVAVGEPILISDSDFHAVIRTITEITKEFDDGQTAICFMGHGTDAESNSVYAKLQHMIDEAGYRNYFIGTVEAQPTIDDLIRHVNAGSYKKVILQPLMIVAGDHANNDMASDDEDSWKSAFEKEGYDVTCILRGLGEFEPVRQLLTEHAREAAAAL